MKFQSDLKKFGLSDKEAAVFLATLGRGPSTVLDISRKSKVARATTYLVLNSLMEIGLVSRIEEDGKTLFVAEPPGQLAALIDRKERQLDQERASLDELLPKLQAFMKTTDGQPTARYYSGREGLKAIRGEMMMYSQPGDTWYQLAPVDYMHSIFSPKDDPAFVQQRRSKGIYSKAIISTGSLKLRKKLEETAERRWAERKFIPKRHYQSPSGFSVYRDRVVISDYGRTVGGVVIESKAMADMMREMFLLWWAGL